MSRSRAVRSRRRLLRADRLQRDRPEALVDARAAADRRARADRSRAREPGRARALFGGAARVSRDPRGPGSRSVRAVQRASAESAEEVEFIRTGGGPWRAAARGAWRRGIRRGRRLASARCSFSTTAGFSTSRAAGRPRRADDAGDLARLAARGTTLVTCPRSNGHTGAGAPPIERFLRVGRARRHRHRQPGERARSERVRRSSRRCARSRRRCRRHGCSRAPRSKGARALGFDADYGTIEPGKSRAPHRGGRPGRVDDVEEYLVSGSSESVDRVALSICDCHWRFIELMSRRSTIEN